jgi:hypothetical protein
MKTHLIAAGALAALAGGCTMVAAPAGAPPEAVAPLTANGEPATLAAEDDPSLQLSAGVVELDTLANQGDAGVKLFGTAGGDPAMNGLYTYIAFYQDPAEGWRIFKLGDFLSYSVLSDSPGRADLEIQESTMDEATGEIGSRTRRVIVEWTLGADGAPPAAITVTPAE